MTRIRALFTLIDSSGTEALDGAGEAELRQVAGGRAGERRRREEGKSCAEHPLVADDVAERGQREE